MPSETPDEAIRRLEAERHMYSETFKNTDAGDPVTRAQLQQEMNSRTNEIQEIRADMAAGGDCLQRIVFLALAAGAGATAWWAPWPSWARLLLAVAAVGLLWIGAS
ncbi:hypothetical protein [Streptomyces albireticuli]|uniref:Uncharacterized protein n=2 Tax=Streptomyces albireticuli TaxID=1940 RepID=A0A2A2D8X3_9ACTN|nr:hypothetical protein [Streptomyces albireticuli]MCD9145895.1 hypothetical protein [Streptomyces albireticuli]MCD9166065.1 hypothetical protein [Streptomyces albireticuli]MCD9196345.1 hypothetical protein [Streptomyces albireticuli]PAU47965.1 hypothetical protein CK936_15765 [Streptomyces albireticuli]